MLNMLYFVSLFQYGCKYSALKKSKALHYTIYRSKRWLTYNKRSSRQHRLHSPSCHRKAGPDWCTLVCCWGLHGDTGTCSRDRLSPCSWPRRCRPHSPGSRHSGTTAGCREHLHIGTVRRGMLGSLSTQGYVHIVSRETILSYVLNFIRLQRCRCGKGTYIYWAEKPYY